MGWNFGRYIFEAKSFFEKYRDLLTIFTKKNIILGAFQCQQTIGFGKVHPKINIVGKQSMSDDLGDKVAPVAPLNIGAARVGSPSTGREPPRECTKMLDHSSEPCKTSGLARMDKRPLG